jgi:hypothetical protein
MMDTKQSSWYGQLQISGIAKPTNQKGSITEMIRDFVIAIRQSSPRELADGKQITILLSTNPIGQDKAKNDKLGLVSAVADSLVETEDLTPTPNEPIDSFINRLIASGHTSMTSRFIAADWYGIEDGEGTDRLRAWLDNPKAIRFRELNTRNEAFESAHPNEYHELLIQMREEFPEFVSVMQLRIAI